MSKKPTYTQSATLSTLDETKRTVECVFSTGDIIKHYVKINDTYQLMPTRVDVTDDAADLEFLKTSGSVLNSHNTWNAQSVIGCVEDAWIKDGKAMARLRFSDAADVEPIWQRVKDGTLRNVSMGFEVTKKQIEHSKDAEGNEVDIMVFTGWRPSEISMVAVPADKGSRTQSGGDHPPKIPQTDATFEQNSLRLETNMTAQNTPQTIDQDAINTVTKKAQRAERDRISQITQAGQSLNMDSDYVQTAIDDGTSADLFRQNAISKFTQASQKQTSGITAQAAIVTVDEHEKFVQGATLGLAQRSGLEGGERNEFTGMTLAELAQYSLRQSSIKIPTDRLQMAGMALQQSGMHGTSDFAEILSNIAGKSALKGWDESEETFHLFTSAGSLPDFKKSKRVGLGLLSTLEKVAEGSEYQYGTVSDRSEEIALATYGKVLHISRQTIINDDLSFFSRLPQSAGRAAKRTIGDLVFAILKDNPLMSDGKKLFHSDHRNLAGTGAALSVDALSIARAAMRTQKESSAKGSPALNIRPANLIVPASLETQAERLMKSPVDLSQNAGHAPNPVAGMANVISDARLDDISTTAWYLAASPTAHDVIEVAYLNGQQAPFIEQYSDPNNDGIKLKVRIDAGVAALDYRTLYKNDGA